MADRSRVSLQYIKSTTAKHTTWVFGLGSACQECLCHCGFMNAPLPTGVLACEVGKLPQCLVWPSPKPLPLQLFKRWQSQTVTPTARLLPRRGLAFLLLAGHGGDLVQQLLGPVLTGPQLGWGQGGDGGHKTWGSTVRCNASSDPPLGCVPWHRHMGVQQQVNQRKK